MRMQGLALIEGLEEYENRSIAELVSIRLDQIHPELVVAPRSRPTPERWGNLCIPYP